MIETLSLTPQMIAVLGLLVLTIILFAFEIVRTDIAAVFVMVLLGLLSLVPGLQGMADPTKLFDGVGIDADPRIFALTGSIMTVVFLVVTLVMLNIIY